MIRTMDGSGANLESVDVYLKEQAYVEFFIERVFKRLAKEELEERMDTGLRAFEDKWDIDFLEYTIEECKENPEKFYTYLRDNPPIDPLCQLCGKLNDGGVAIFECDHCKWFKMVCEPCNEQVDPIYRVRLGRKMLILHAVICGGCHVAGTTYRPTT